MKFLDHKLLDQELATLAKAASEQPDANAAAQVSKSMLSMLVRSIALSVKHVADRAGLAYQGHEDRLRACEAASTADLKLFEGFEQRLQKLEGKR